MTFLPPSSVVAFLAPGSSVRPAPSLDVAADADLVVRARSGDRAAAGLLCARHAPRVRALLVRRAPLADLPDLVQEVLLHALRDLAKLREPALFRAWILGIASHLARRAARAARRRAWLGFAPHDELPELAAPSADVDAREELSALLPIVATLPPDERAAFVLRFVDGLELADAARSLGVSLATVKRRIARAEQRVRSSALAIPALAVRAS